MEVQIKMQTVKKKYITVEGEIKNYCYIRKEYKDRTRKPKCPTCNYKLRYLNYLDMGQYIKPGFVCINCGSIFIDNKYKAFKMRYE